MKEGIIYIATGKRFVSAAIRSAESAKKTNSNIPIHLFCDFSNINKHGLTFEIFDSVEDIENPHYRSKVDYIEKSPFEKTIYIDSDTRIVSDLTDVFRVLEKYDIALCHAHARNHDKTTQYWNTPIPYAFPQMNGGVIAYKKNETVKNFLLEWKDSFHKANFKKDQVTLRELLWKSDLRIATLPPEYNIRYVRYLIQYWWYKKEAEPKILHFQRYNFTLLHYIIYKFFLITRLRLLIRPLKKIYANYRNS